MGSSLSQHNLLNRFTTVCFMNTGVVLEYFKKGRMFLHILILCDNLVVTESRIQFYLVLVGMVIAATSSNYASQVSFI